MLRRVIISRSVRSRAIHRTTMGKEILKILRNSANLDSQHIQELLRKKIIVITKGKGGSETRFTK